MTSDELVNIFAHKIYSAQLSSKELNEDEIDQEIIDSYFSILDVLSKDYESYRKYVPHILSTLENNDLVSITYSINIFLNLYDKLISMKDLSMFDKSIMRENVSDDISKHFLDALKNTYKLTDQIRVSDFDFKGESLSEKQKREAASLLIKIIQDQSEEFIWNINKAENALMFLAPLRWLLISLDNIEMFYYTAGMVFDRLNTSEFFQSARDFSEEILISSFIDKVPEFGFFNSFRCYSVQSSIHAGILYANLSLFSIIRSGNIVSNKFIEEVIWQSVIYFRNTKLYPWAIYIYENIPKHIEFEDYERRAIDHSFFICMMLTMDSSLPEKLIDYLNKEREGILSGGYVETAPWLITLYNVQRVYKEADFSATSLGFYLSVFESIVPKELVERQKDIILGDSAHLKVYLKESLSKLMQTRSKLDILYDNEMAIKIASRLIPDSFLKKDEEAVLLAMMLKSDFSLIFQSTEATGLMPFKLESFNLKNFQIDQLSKENILFSLTSKSTDFFIWISVSENKVFQLSLLNRNFKFNFINSWNWKLYKYLMNSEFFSNISFDDTVKEINGSIRNVLPEEFLQESTDISKKIDIMRFIIEGNVESIMLIKDMDLAKFPHNLMLDERREFLHLSKPLTNVLSTEWYISNKAASVLKTNFSKSIWIPIEGGDFTLNQLFGKLENYLNTAEFNIFKEIRLMEPISSDLNIICSHGDKDIAVTQLIYPNNNPLANLGRVIGEGKILIFFVCHSGSYQNEYFRNNITSIAKNYISQGYKAVIAPFWALHIYVPAIWLPKFINSLNSGQSIDKAVFQANKAVYEVYPTPAAWACMHLYGNPHITTTI